MFHTAILSKHYWFLTLDASETLIHQLLAVYHEIRIHGITNRRTNGRGDLPIDI